MRYYAIDSQKNITVHATQEAAAAAGTPFQGAGEFSALTNRLKMPELAQIWNLLDGVKPVKRFMSRDIAVKRIWILIDRMNPLVPIEEAPKGKKRAAKAPAAETPKVGKKKPAAKAPAAEPAKPGSKADIILGMIRRPDGATLDELMKAAGWQRHSVRGFIAGTAGKKMGLTVVSSKDEDGSRRYTVKG
jgi:hypothetical protein